MKELQKTENLISNRLCWFLRVKVDALMAKIANMGQNSNLWIPFGTIFMYATK